MIFALASIQSAPAREPDGARKEIAALLQSPRPLRIGVVGDSIGGDLGRGMQKIVLGRDNLHVVTFTKAATGLMRDDVYDWQNALRRFLGKTRLDIIAVMIGGNDRQSIWKDGKRLIRGSDAWRAEYRRRLGQFMAALKKTNAKIYWVGLPPVRTDQMSRDYRMLNEMYRSEARRHGFTYVSTWEVFADAKGRYTSFGRALDGSKRRMRQNDGMHFTIPGELRLAHTVARVISRDLAKARAGH